MVIPPKYTCKVTKDDRRAVTASVSILMEILHGGAARSQEREKIVNVASIQTIFGR